MNHTELIPHLFRTEFSKITAVLTRMLGMANLSVAEDIAGETFLTALETWPYKGIPENPVAWLYTVAKNKTKNQVHRNRLFKEKIANIEQPPAEVTDHHFSEQNISDSLLQMMFAICHPSIPQESQIGLSLRILCGFGIDEIASAFLTNKETINKRLFRAKEKIRTENIQLEFPASSSVDERLSPVMTTIYLLFNEGYYSENSENIIRKELCAEAMRLALMLIENPKTNKPAVTALMALMCFQASRLDARMGDDNEPVLYDEQDELKWNAELVARGAYYFHQSSTGNQLSKFHLEAGIAYWYTVKEDSLAKWENILQLYNRLLQVQYSPVVALNRTYALSKARGINAGIREAEKLCLDKNRFYHMLLGKLYSTVDLHKSMVHLKLALRLSKSQVEKRMIEKQVAKLTT